MTTPENSLLNLLPYPLMQSLPKDELDSLRTPKFVSAQNYTFQESTPKDLAAYRNELVDLRTLQRNPYESDYFAAEHGLHPVGYGFYHSKNLVIQPTHRVSVLSLLIAPNYLLRGRFSRYTAAWIWGYNRKAPEIHIDFDRNKRINRTRAHAQSIKVHQVKFTAFEHESFGGIKVTTPYRTAYDLLVYEDNLKSLSLVCAILKDHDSDCTLEMLQRSLAANRYIQGKEQVSQRIDKLTQWLS